MIYLFLLPLFLYVLKKRVYSLVLSIRKEDSNMIKNEVFILFLLILVIVGIVVVNEFVF